MRSRSLTTSLALLTGMLAGGEALAASGGPDAFGYRFEDQDEGVAYNFVDISMTGMEVTSGVNMTAPVTLSVPFTIYGQQVLNDVVVSTNGFITDTAGETVDPTNDCPLPAPAGGAPGSFRIAVFHTTLFATVYYEYFDQVQAGMIGYPGQAMGVSILQWTGEHVPTMGQQVSAQIVLFHDDDSMRVMVAADDLGGAESTIGIQNPDATIGLTYGCNDPGFVTPGATAVRFWLTDSDCCSASPTNQPGCLDPTCEAAVCAANASCCDTEWDQACANAATSAHCAIFCGGAPPPVTINEIRIAQTDNDDDEYFELQGPPGTVLDELTYIVIGDPTTGQIEAAIDLVGQVIPASGYFVVAEDSFLIGTADLVTTLNFENDDTVTHMLVGGFSASDGDLLDTDEDGMLDMEPWAAQLDTVAVISSGMEEFPYGPGSSCMMGATCQEIDDPGTTPEQIYRCVDGTGTWFVGNTDVDAIPSTDTPGSANACTNDCGNGIVEMGEDCDERMETAGCDADCTNVECGDTTVNSAAGEECDDGNTEDGDGCSSACIVEAEPTTGGMESSGGDPTSTGSSSSSDGLDGTGSSTGPGPGAPTGSTSTTPIGTSGGTTGASNTNGGGGIVPQGGSCNCTTDPSRGVPWSVWALLGLGSIGVRRRRRA